VGLTIWPLTIASAKRHWLEHGRAEFIGGKWPPGRPAFQP
jgi:hypothetical protein